MEELVVRSKAFRNGEFMPSKYTCDGQGINPPLIIEGIPPEIKSLAIIMEDPDAPAGTFNHWVTWNIPPIKVIEEDSSPGTEGINSAREPGYRPPCPPFGTHRYVFKVYALNIKLTLNPLSIKEDLEHAMLTHILAQGELTGLYKRTK